jgi:tagatose 1,6-diphosphate aldolase
MSASFSKEKIQRLQALADERGVIAAIGMDQRGSLLRAIAAGKGVGADELTDATIHDLKSAVSRAFTPHASAILLDPEWGLAAAEARHKDAGVLFAYEQSGYDIDRPGRMADLLPGFSVRRLKELGADAVKLLLHYTPHEDEAINDRKHAFLERVGAECRAEGMPFFLALLAYDESGGDPHGLAFAHRKPDIVAESVRELSRERYAVDLLGVEPPVNLRYADGSGVFAGSPAYSKQRALDHYRASAAAAERPFVYLSAGVSSAQLTESLHWAAEAGVNFAGAVCGRAAWGGGVDIYCSQGLAAFEDWLSDEGVRNFDAVRAALANAGSWYSFYGASTPSDLAE